jgi:hypothetical protein
MDVKDKKKKLTLKTLVVDRQLFQATQEALVTNQF